MKKFPLIYLNFFSILFIALNLISGEITDNSFSSMQNIDNVEYNGSVVQLILSGAKPIAGNETKGAVLDKGYPSFALSHTGSPTIIKDNGIYKMWFAGYDGVVSRIGYAISSDGINWAVYSNTGGGMKGAVIGPENTPSFASSHASEPTVIKDNGIYKMWFAGNDGSGYRIGYAVSSDGINWTVYSNSSGGMKGAVIGPENSPSFASGASGSSPTVIEDNGVYKMWFQGYDGSVYRIGYATAVHPGSGTFVSRVLDAGYKVNLQKLYFYADIYDSTSIKFQIRGANSLSELESSAFTGPDNTSDTYFTVSGESISGITNVRYIQYKAYFNTLNEEYSPKLIKVNIAYSSLYEQSGEENNVYLYPIPYKPETGDMSIRFSLEESSKTEISIYTVDGEKIWSKDVTGSTGWNIVQWNGCDSAGRNMRSGTYICVIKKRYSSGDKYIRKHIFLVR